MSSEQGARFCVRDHPSVETRCAFLLNFLVGFNIVFTANIFVIIIIIGIEFCIHFIKNLHFSHKLDLKFTSLRNKVLFELRSNV